MSNLVTKQRKLRRTGLVLGNPLVAFSAERKRVMVLMQPKNASLYAYASEELTSVSAAGRPILGSVSAGWM